MTCSNHRTLLAEEMSSLLNSIESDIAELETERNNLKSEFQKRSPEEKNIVKDVLSIHTEFDIGVSRIREIVDEISTLPQDKIFRTTKAEEIAKELIKLQSELVKKHELLQKALNRKLDSRNIKDDIEGRVQSAKEELESGKFKITEIENYEHGNLFNKKVKMLNGELSRLKGLLANPFLNAENDSDGVNKLSLAEAGRQLQNTQSENKKLEEALGKINSKYLTKEKFLKLKRDVDDRTRRVAELRKVLNLVNDEVKELMTPGSPISKIKFLDNIVGRRSGRVSEAMSPRSAKRNSTLLQDIEASLLRVKAMSSPPPKK